MLDFKIKLRPFGKTYFLLSPVDRRIYPVFLSLFSDLAFRVDTVKKGAELLEFALHEGWIVVGLIKQSSNANNDRGYYTAEVLLSNHALALDDGGLMLNKLVALLKILEHNVQMNARLPIYLNIHKLKKLKNGLEKIVIKEEFISAAAFAHLLMNKLTFHRQD